MGSGCVWTAPGGGADWGGLNRHQAENVHRRHGNAVHYFNLVRPHSRLSITSRSTVETGLAQTTEVGEELVQDFLRFRSPAKDVPGVRDLARDHAIADPSSAEATERALDALTLAINRDFAYDRSVTNVYSSVDEVLALRAGVCQDFAHLFIAAARAMGVPARYVSGYIHIPGDKGATTASHAWAKPSAGQSWIGYDATGRSAPRTPRAPGGRTRL
jgi:transglutaminase-like putative cysteine protease